MTSPILAGGAPPASPASPTPGEHPPAAWKTARGERTSPGQHPAGGGSSPSLSEAPPAGSTRPSCAAERHNTATAYVNSRCRCTAARMARTRQLKLRHLRGHTFTDATGTRRRLEALMWMGWSGAEIGHHIGWKSGVGALLHKCRHGQRVEVNTARLIATAYDRLSMTRGPSRRAHCRASAAGYVPPLAWDDDTIDNPDARPNCGHNLPSVLDVQAVHLAVGGVPVRLRPAERHAAVQALTGQGFSARQVAEHLDIQPRSVTRRRSAAQRLITDNTSRKAG